MQQNPKGRKARWIAELKNYDFKAKHWPDNDNGIADYLSWNLISKPINYIKDEQIYLKFVRVVTYYEDGIWMSTRLKSPMKGSLQVVFGKSDGEELQTAARRWQGRFIEALFMGKIQQNGMTKKNHPFTH